MNFTRWLSHLCVRQRAQNTLEYGIVVATIVVATIAGLSALQGAEGAYFTGMQQTLAPTPIPCGSACTGLRSYQTTVSCAASSLFVNNSDLCTVTVTDTSSSPTTPTGSVTWTKGSTGTFSGSNPCSLVAINSSSASCNITYQPQVIGSHTLTATYNLTPQLPGTIATTTLTVSPRPTTIAVSCSPSSNVMLSTATTCTATVSDNGGSNPSTPTGTVTWTSSGTATWAAGSGSFSAGPPVTCTLSGGTCSVNYTPTVLGSGTHAITGAYGGDSIHSGQSRATNVGVVAIATTTTVNCSPNPVDASIATICTVTVAGGPIPTGTVTLAFSGPGNPLSTSCPLNGSGQCQVTYTPSSAAGQTVTASYAGDSTHAASTSGSNGLTVNKRTTSVGVNCSQNPVVYNSSTPTTSCTARVNDTDGGTVSTPSGTITWSGGTGSFSAGGTCTLSGTPATCSVTFTPSAPAANSLTATYSGDAMHASTASSPYSLTVNKRSSSVAVNCTPITFHGSPASSSCTATVTDSTSGTTSTPTGQITWSGPASFSSPTCNLSSGSCGVTYTPNAAGADTVTATYAGDSNHNGSSGSGTVTINKRTTTTSVTCVPASVPVNSSSTCTAVVTDTDPGTPSVPTGTVTWNTNHGTFNPPAGTCALVGTGFSNQASCSIIFTRQNGANVSIDGSYGGDAIEKNSSGSTPMP